MSNLHELQFGKQPEAEQGSYEKEFGTKTGSHTHPVTHPNWMQFANDSCPTCVKKSGT